MPEDSPQQQKPRSVGSHVQADSSIGQAPETTVSGQNSSGQDVSDQSALGPLVDQSESLMAEGNLAVALEPRIALVGGEPFTQLPLDLYIPPDALEVILEAFEGPLDLLLYLIKRQNLDILNIPISAITAQYMKYIGMMETMKFELAAEYLVMAAMLAEIKSRMLLPRIEEDGEDDSDPRAELIRRLQEFERIKKSAITLDEMPRMEREHQQLYVVAPEIKRDVPHPEVSMKELMLALREVAERAERMGNHSISRETLSVRARMTHVLSVLQIGEFCEFSTLFNPEEGRLGLVVSFLAILELCKESTIDIVQSETFAPIYIKLRTAAAEPREGGADEGVVGEDKSGDSSELAEDVHEDGASKDAAKKQGGPTDEAHKDNMPMDADGADMPDSPDGAE